MKVEEAEDLAECSGVGCDNLTRLRMSSTGEPWCARCMNKTRTRHSSQHRANEQYRKWKK